LRAPVRFITGLIAIQPGRKTLKARHVSSLAVRDTA
jgi:hypothetical protein